MLAAMAALCMSASACARAQDIMRDKWVNVGYEDAPIEPYDEPSLHLEDETRIAELVKLGFKRDDIRDSLVGRKFDTIYATYMLLGRAVRTYSPSTAHVHVRTLYCAL